MWTYVKNIPGLLEGAHTNEEFWVVSFVDFSTKSFSECLPLCKSFLFHDRSCLFCSHMICELPGQNSLCNILLERHSISLLYSFQIFLVFLNLSLQLLILKYFIMPLSTWSITECELLENKKYFCHETQWNTTGNHIPDKYIWTKFVCVCVCVCVCAQGELFSKLAKMSKSISLIVNPELDTELFPGF
jgi:hypothetical protein